VNATSAPAEIPWQSSMSDSCSVCAGRYAGLGGFAFEQTGSLLVTQQIQGAGIRAHELAVLVKRLVGQLSGRLPRRVVEQFCERKPVGHRYLRVGVAVN
jgi:hypothetical protein